MDSVTKRFSELRAFEQIAAALFVLLVIAFATAGWYGYTRIQNLSLELATLQGNLASTTEELALTNTSLSSSIEAQSKNVASVKQQLGGVQNTVGSIGGTVDTLQKLSKLDPELLEKYSKVFFLSENYVPASLASIPDSYKYFNDRQMQLIPQVLPHLEDMFDDAKHDGIVLYVYSAYRSFGTQAALKNGYTVVYGAGTANSFSADQGYSEHQLGTTVDLITTGQGGELKQSFDQSAAYSWLSRNAYKYGFTPSYPKGNSYYIYEPWHWRFVGTKLATDLHTSGQHFYDLDQRAIDTYLISIFN